MRTDFMPHKMICQQLFCLLLTIGLTLTINSASAEDINTEIPLKVTGAWEKVELEFPIWVEVENLGKWAEKPGNDVSKFTLCLDGNVFKDIRPSSVRGNLLGFHFRPTSESRNAWKTVICPPFKKDGKPVLVTLRLDSAQVAGGVMAPVTVINWFGLKVFLVSVVVALIVFGWLAVKSDILRAPGAQPKGIDKYGKPNRKLYSLARTQMACWFFVVVISYVFIWMLTSDLASLTSSVLALIGISAATGLASAAVDSGKRGDMENLRHSLEEKKKQAEAAVERLRTEISTLNTNVSATPAPTNLEEQRATIAAKQGDLAGKEMEINQSKRKIREIRDVEEPAPSKGFLNDVLSDEEGVSFHRFQMFAWAIVLMVIFIGSVWDALAMPDFDPTLLALMGISGGTYIGFKLPAQQG